MTNTLTTDIPATVAQVNRASNAGADIVRTVCTDQDSTAALCIAAVNVPIIADIHFTKAGH